MEHTNTTHHAGHSGYQGQTKETIVLSKKMVYGGILVFLIIIGGLFYFLKYYPEQKHMREVQIYKRTLYENILCR